MLAMTAGVMRRVETIVLKRKQTYGSKDEDDHQRALEGALGEMALAKYLGVYWHGKGKCWGPDMIGGHEVRTTSYQSGRLILHPEDKDDLKYWLVTGINGTYQIRGFKYGRDGKQKQYWDDPQGGRPAFFVPQNDLIFQDDQ